MVSFLLKNSNRLLVICLASMISYIITSIMFGFGNILASIQFVTMIVSGLAFLASCFLIGFKELGG